MLEGLHIGLKVDVDTLRGTREGVPRLAALFKRHGLNATFYFSVGPDHTGRAMRRVFRKGFAKKVARTSVVKHYGIKTLLYGVLLPGPDIARQGGDCMRRVRDQGFEVGLHTFDHVRWQDYVAEADASWTRREFERGMEAFKDVFGAYPASHAAAGWQMNAAALKLEQEFDLKYASDARGLTPFWPRLTQGRSRCLQLPTTLPTFDELLGRDGIDESSIAARIFDFAQANSARSRNLHIFTLHAELEGMLLIDAFDELLTLWRESGASLVNMAQAHELATSLGSWPDAAMGRGEVDGRSGLLAVQDPGAAALA
jgi:peptidoglycan/xylan/chitin deacetylase (PgdA/CDA1 family)